MYIVTYISDGGNVYDSVHYHVESAIKRQNELIENTRALVQVIHVTRYYNQDDVIEEHTEAEVSGYTFRSDGVLESDKQKNQRIRINREFV